MASKYTNHTFPKKLSRTEPAELRLKPKFVKSSSKVRQKLVKGVPSSPHRASQCSQMEPWATKLVYFSDVLDDFRPLSLKIAPGMHFSLKTTLPDCLNRPAELLRLCIRRHCSPGLDRLGCFGLALGNHCSLGRCGYAFEITGRSAAMLQTLLRATSLAP